MAASGAEHRRAVCRDSILLLAGRARLQYGCVPEQHVQNELDLTGLHREELHIDVEGGELDYYVLLGDDPAAVVKGFTALTGRMPLPPRWALGYHQARWTYTPDAEVLRIAQGFRERRIPCDTIHLDIDHMDGCRVFTWDPVAFADPARLCRALADRGFKTVVIVDAGIKQHEVSPSDHATARASSVRYP